MSFCHGCLASVHHAASFLPTDFQPKKYKKAGVTNAEKAMGSRFNNEVTMGGLDDTDIELERPASLGPVQSHVRMPALPSGLQRNHDRKNRVCALRRSTY